MGNKRSPELPGKNTPAPPPRPCYNMTIQTPKDCKDDVSDVTFITGSVSSLPRPAMHCDAIVEDNMEVESRSCINTHEYDEKGRCVRHPYIQLRKKNMFGSNWKVLMSACPDCCVDELKQIRLVEENRRKLRSGHPGQRRSSSKVRLQNSTWSSPVNSSSYSNSRCGSKTSMSL